MKAAMKDTVNPVDTKLAHFSSYRVTLHSTTGVPTAELLMGRRLRTYLDPLHSDIPKRIRHELEKQKEGHDKTVGDRGFRVADKKH